MSSQAHYDWIVIGSGFGGSVSALRLVEKGYRVLLLEKGSELAAKDFPKTNWNVRRWLWMPRLGFRGLFQMRFFRHVTVLAGVGVGGGSLVYANTLPIPKDDFYSSPSWGALAAWKQELAPHYETARRMLGAVPNPIITPPDRILRKLAERRGAPEAWEPTNVAVLFGTPGQALPDPFFDGEGPDRVACNYCGACMTGCRHGAKNTLDKNYLHLARARGLELRADSEVVRVRPDPQGGYLIDVLHGRRMWLRKRVTYHADKVVFSGGVLGTVDLLLRMKADAAALPKLSPRLGNTIRTNSESLIAITAKSRETDLSHGVAIGSIFQTDPHSHLEPVRYGSGSGFFKLLGAPHVPGNQPGIIKLVRAMGMMIRHPGAVLRTYLVSDWAKHTMILLYMRTTEGTLRFRKGLFGMGSTLESGESPTASIPEASALAEEVATELESVATSLVTETALNIPTTAHILGGCCMGDSPETGVIDARHRVHNYDGLYVIDGSAISANPGVNPSLTITAMAERAMSFIPRNPAAVGSGAQARPLPKRAQAALPETSRASP